MATELRLRFPHVQTWSLPPTARQPASIDNDDANLEGEERIAKLRC